MTMKMTLKLKNRSQRYDINRPKPRNKHKYTKTIKQIINKYQTTPKQHLKLSS